MKSVIDQLDRESLLVIHAAGELSPDDARRVEAILAADPALRTEYDGLWHTLRTADDALAADDSETRLPVDPRVAERRIGRMVREWVLTRPERAPTVVQKVVGLKYPWWAYPLTAAAAIFLAFLVWWGNTPMRPDQYVDKSFQQSDDSSTTEPTDEETQLVDDLERSFSHPSRERIRAVEGELYALSTASEGPEEPAAPPQQQDVNQ